MDKILKFITKGLLIIVIIGLGAFLFLWLTEWKPPQKGTISTSQQSDPINDTITILSWNIGYAGLGSNMDFFYDGGKKVRDSKERTVANLKNIINEIAKADADIVLLQEVDIDSHRSYRIHQFDSLYNAFKNYKLFFAYTYKSAFVPVPLKEPTKNIASGMVIMSKFDPITVIRHQFPKAHKFPASIFNMKRCMMSAYFLNSKGDTVMISNTHNSAYEGSQIRGKEMGLIASIVNKDHLLSIIGGDWNQNPPEYIQSQRELTDKHFRPSKIDKSLFGDNWQIAYDTINKTCRYLDYPLSDSTTKTTTDFFIASPKVKVIEVKTIDLGFESSDHNPVIGKFVF